MLSSATRRRALTAGIEHLFLIALAVLVYYPFLFLVMTSFKDIPQFYHEFWLPAFPLHPENYDQAWKLIHRYVVNSVIVTSSSVIGVLIVAS